MRTDGNKEVYKKRHLYVTVNKLYKLFREELKLFREELPLKKISRMKFAELWPTYVCCCGDMPHQICMCYYLKYFIILVDTLHKSNSDILTYSHDFVSSLLCTPPTNSYSNRLCENCREGKLINSVTKY